MGREDMKKRFEEWLKQIGYVGLYAILKCLFKEFYIKQALKTTDSVFFVM